MAFWPDSTNTGYPDGVILTPSGGLTITKAGTVISGLDINGPVIIRANNVTIQNCNISSSDYSVINIGQGITGTVIKNCEIDGEGVAGAGIGGQGTFIGNNIHHVADGINVQGDNTLIQDNYIHDLYRKDGGHYDGIQMDGGFSHVKVLHNTIINDKGQTSAIMIDGYWGDISDIVVDNNLLVGGDYTIYATGVNVRGSVTDIQITNNHLGKGTYGYTIFEQAGVTASGNVNDGYTLLAQLGNGDVPSGDSGTPDVPDTPPPPPPTDNNTATSGDDTLSGNSQNNTIDGLGGNDRIDGGAGNDTLIGGAGNDILIGGAGRDTMTGGTGSDVFLFKSLADMGSTASTRDIITDFTPGTDKIDLSAIDANSKVAGLQNFVFLPADHQSFTGKPGELAWETDTARNVTIIQGDVNGDGVHDFEIQLSGIKTLKASDFVGVGDATTPTTPPPTTPPPDPTPTPDPTPDPTPTTGSILGTTRGDRLNGDAGNNLIDGKAGNDVINGGAGNDTIIGGAGRDTMTGGAGADFFVFKSATDSGSSPPTRDIITDFTRGLDKIDLSAIDANAAASGNQAFKFIAGNDASFTHTAGELAWRTDAAHNQTIIQGDVNGDGVHDFEIQLTGIVNLTGSDFVL